MINKNTVYQKIKLGLQSLQGKVILHSAPHHDDILLGYFPYAHRLLAGNTNHVVYMTPGDRGVSDQYLAKYESLSLSQVDLMPLEEKQFLKATIRQKESEKKWMLISGDTVRVHHFNAQFYHATPDLLDAAFYADVKRMADYLMLVKPDVITVLQDASGIGPISHHRSAQLMNAAIDNWKHHEPEQAKKLRIIGYRNIWTTFSYDQASMIIPCTAQELANIESIFKHCFLSQSNSMIMTPDEDNELVLMNFAEQSTYIMTEQWNSIAQSINSNAMKALGLDPLAIKGAIFLQD